jgi:hypothetical protein
MNDFSGADINQLREFLNSEAGRKFLMILVNEETTLLATAFNKKTSLEMQGQTVNRVSGIYWVRSWLNQMITEQKSGRIVKK